MKEKFVSSSINFIQKYQECDDLKLKKLKYGLEGIYSVILKISTVILISIFTQTIIETLLLIIFYTGIRTFSFGWHAKKNITCWITTITLYNGLPFLIKYTTIPNIVGYIILGVGLISMILWAPADTPRRPLIRKEQRKKAKTMSILVIILYTIIYILTDLNIVKNAMIYSLIMQILFINPLTYKLTKTPFNNYKNYKKKDE